MFLGFYLYCLFGVFCLVGEVVCLVVVFIGMYDWVVC